MIKTLTQQGIPVREVDGSNSPEDVLERIEEVLADWGMIQEKQYAQINPKHNFEIHGNPNLDSLLLKILTSD